MPPRSKESLLERLQKAQQEKLNHKQTLKKNIIIAVQHDKADDLESYFLQAQERNIPLKELTENFLEVDFTFTQGNEIKRIPLNLFNYACCANKPNIVKLLLEKYTLICDEINTEDSRYKISILSLAVCQGHTKVVTILLRHGANPLQEETYEKTALHYACISQGNDKFPILSLLLENIKQEKITNTQFYKQLMDHYDNNVFQFFCSKRIFDPNFIVELKGGAFLSLLSYALSKKDKTKTKLLLAHTETDINYIHGNGFTPLMWAVSQDVEDDTFKKILKNPNLSINATTNQNATALHIAIAYERIKKVRTLLQHGADLHIPFDINGSKMTPLVFLCTRPHLLKELAKDINRNDFSHPTFLAYLSRYVNFSTFENIITLPNFDPNAVFVNTYTHHMVTLLDFSILSNDIQGVRALLKLPHIEVDLPGVKEFSAITLIEHVCFHAKIEILEILLKYPKKFPVLNSDTDSIALYYALNHEDSEKSRSMLVLFKDYFRENPQYFKAYISELMEAVYDLGEQQHFECIENLYEMFSPDITCSKEHTDFWLKILKRLYAVVQTEEDQRFAALYQKLLEYVSPLIQPNQVTNSYLHSCTNDEDSAISSGYNSPTSDIDNTSTEEDAKKEKIKAAPLPTKKEKTSLTWKLGRRQVTFTHDDNDKIHAHSFTQNTHDDTPKVFAFHRRPSHPPVYGIIIVPPEELSAVIGGDKEQAQKILQAENFSDVQIQQIGDKYFDKIRLKGVNGDVRILGYPVKQQPNQPLLVVFGLLENHKSIDNRKKSAHSAASCLRKIEKAIEKFSSLSEVYTRSMPQENSAPPPDHPNNLRLLF